MFQTKENWPSILAKVPDDDLKAEYVRRFGVGRPAKLRPCPHCGKQFGSTELRLHKPRCPVMLQRKLIAAKKAEAEREKKRGGKA